MKVRQRLCNTVDNASFLAQRRYVGRKYLVVREGWKELTGGRRRNVEVGYFGKLSWIAQTSLGCVKAEVVVSIVDFQMMVWAVRWNMRCVGQRMLCRGGGERVGVPDNCSGID